MPTPEDGNFVDAVKAVTHSKVNDQALNIAIADGKEDNLITVYNKVLQVNARANPLDQADEARAVKTKFTHCDMTCRWSTVNWQCNIFREKKMPSSLATSLSVSGPCPWVSIVPTAQLPTSL